MRAVPKPVMSPAICMICERAHGAKDRPWVDTLSQFDVGVVTFLTGRKYLCPGCVGKAAIALGYMTPADAEEALEALREADERLAKLEARSRDLAALERVLGHALAVEAEEDEDVSEE